MVCGVSFFLGFYLVYGLKEPFGLCHQGGAGAARPSSPKSP
jgi:hypothetical protein